MLGGLSSNKAGGPRFDGRFAVRATTAVLILALLVQFVRLVLVFVDPVRADPGAASPAVDAVRPAAFTGFDPFFRNGGVGDTPSSAGAPTESDLVLYGVRGGGGRGAAILSGPDGVQRSYAVGQQVRPGVVLRSVAFDHVVLARGGAESRLGFPALTAGASTPPAVISAGPIAASAPKAAAPGSNAAAAFQREAALRPNLVDRRIRGYVLTVQDGSGVLARAGLRTGDVIMSVNGTSLDADSLSSLPAELAARPEIAVSYERDGAPGSATVRPAS